MYLSFTQKRVLTWCLIAAFAWVVLWRLAPVLTPFVVAAVLAYALNPLVDKLCALSGDRLPRLLAVLLVSVLFLVVISGLLLLVVSIVANELPLLQAQVPAMVARLSSSVNPWLAQHGIYVTLDAASLQAGLMRYLSANGDEVWASVFTSLRLGGNVALVVVGYAFLIPVALIYLLMDWSNFVHRVVAWVPPRFRAAFDGFTNESSFVLGQYLRGQLLVMGVLAVFYSLGLALFGLDLALPIGIFTGLAVFVPYVGFSVGLVLALIAGFLEFTAVKTLVMVTAVYGLGQIVESFFLTPRLVGERVGLHPLMVIFSLLAFGQLFGFMGVLLALPISAVLLVAVRRLRVRYMSSKLYRG